MRTWYYGVVRCPLDNSSATVVDRIPSLPLAETNYRHLAPTTAHHCLLLVVPWFRSFGRDGGPAFDTHIVVLLRV